MLQCLVYVFLAPALVRAAAFPWAGPEPTLVIPEIDHWSPAPTEAPKIGEIELLKRADDSTCGYISGDPNDPLTCNDFGFVCATNANNGVHGCCNPESLSQCSLSTTCIPFTAMSVSCTDDCLFNDYIAKCTNSLQGSCYEWHYDYGSTVMTEYGCTSFGFTVTAQRNPSVSTSDISDIVSDVELDIATSEDGTSITSATGFSVTSLGSASASRTSSSTDPSDTAGTAPTSPEQTEEKEEKKPEKRVAIIAGVVVGAVFGIAAIALAAFCLIRFRKRKNAALPAASNAANVSPGMDPAPGVTEYKPQPTVYQSPQDGYASPAPAAPYHPAAGGYYAPDHNKPQQQQPWQQQHQYAPIPQGVAEVPGSMHSPQYPQQYQNQHQQQTGPVHEAP